MDKIKYMKRLPAGFGVAHFPIGTIFELNENVCWMDHKTGVRAPAIHTVHGIVRNGYQSYVLKTGVMKKLGESEIEEAFNIEHVKRIISRGNGEVKVEETWYGMNKPMSRSELEHSSLLNDLTRRGYYVTISIRDVLYYELAKFVKLGTSVDFSSLVDAVLANSWVKPVTDGEHFWSRAKIINKKRLRKFLRQNLNRHLINLTRATKDYNEACAKDAEEDWNREWDREHGEELDTKPNKDCGSHYDNDDPSYTRPESWNERHHPAAYSLTGDGPSPSDFVSYPNHH